MLKTIFKVSLLSSAILIVFYAFNSIKITNINSIGAFDFVYYYIPFQVFKSGANPYDVSNLAQEFSKIPRYEDHAPLIFLYAPHILILLSPFLCWSFASSVTIWIITSLILLIVSAYSAIRTTTREQNNILLFTFAAAIFPPAFESISWGQSSLVLAVGTIGIYSTIKNNNPIWFGLFALLCSFKPHLIIGIASFLLIYLIRNRKFDFFKSLLIWFSVTATVTELMSPGIWLNWLESYTLSANHGMSMLNPVLVDLIQLFSLLIFKKMIFWPAFIIPIIGGLICFLLAIKQDFEINFIFVLIISYLFAPYGWYYDQSMLMLVYAYSLTKASLTNKRLVGLAILPIISLIIFKLFIGNAQHQYLWFPLILLSNLILIKKISTQKHFVEFQ